MSLESRTTGILTDSGTLSVPADVSKHQLKIEFYDAAGNTISKGCYLEIFGRVPGAVTFDYLMEFSPSMGFIRWPEAVVTEFQFLQNTANLLPEGTTFQIFWNSIS